MAPFPLLPAGVVVACAAVFVPATSFGMCITGTLHQGAGRDGVGLNGVGWGQVGCL